MRGQSEWSYAPYKPFLFHAGDIYICRIVPDMEQIYFEWLGEKVEYTIYVRERGTEAFSKCGVVIGNDYMIRNLGTGIDYEFYVEAGEKKSRIRIARTGETVGTVVNYLHPEDKAYSFSGAYLCSPSLVQYPDGCLLASMDLFDYGQPQNLTLIFRSDDNGETWQYVSELMPCFWGKLFLHKGELYMLACSTEYGDLLIGKSLDRGKTFSAPSVLLRGSGRNNIPGVHKNPQNVLVHKGRIYETLEWEEYESGNCCYAPMVMSCDADDDLMVPENWHFTPPLKYDPKWPGTVQGKANGNMEGTLCVSPEGELLNVMRYIIRDAVPAYGLVLAYKVNVEDPDAALTYSHAIQMPCNNAKFMIKFDEVSGRYYSIVNRIDCEERIYRRNLLSLMVSKDMKTWEVVCDLIDKREADMDKVGFQYADFFFDGEDIIFLCRTAINGANSFHDANYSTFHRVKNFRSFSKRGHKNV